MCLLDSRRGRSSFALPTNQTTPTNWPKSAAEHNVKRLEIFGSDAVGDFNPEKSDIEFLVDYHLFTGSGKVDAYFGILEDFQQLYDLQID